MRTTTWTIVGDLEEKDIPMTVEKHDVIGISDFDFSKKEVCSG